MAYTASTGFRYGKSLLGEDSPMALKFRVANSKTIRIGDVVRVNTAGLVDLVGAGVAVLGVVIGIVDELGINPFSMGYLNSTGATLTPDDTVVTSSTNSTRAHYIQVEVFVDPAGTLLFYNDANGDLAQTNLLQFFDVVAASNQIDQATASDTSGQFQLVVLDPDGDGDASKGLFRVVESELVQNVNSYNSTAVLAA